MKLKVRILCLTIFLCFFTSVAWADNLFEWNRTIDRGSDAANEYWFFSLGIDQTTIPGNDGRLYTRFPATLILYFSEQSGNPGPWQIILDGDRTQVDPEGFNPNHWVITKSINLSPGDGRYFGIEHYWNQFVLGQGDVKTDFAAKGVTLYFDPTPPSIVAAPSSWDSNHWYNDPGRLTNVWSVNISSSDSFGVDSRLSTYQIYYSATASSGVNASNVTNLTPVASGALGLGANNVSIPTNSPDGYYYIRAVGSDYAHNTSSDFNGPFKYDHTKPVLSSNTAVPTIDGSGKLNLVWGGATDAMSGPPNPNTNVRFAFSAAELNGTLGTLLFPASTETNKTIDIPQTFNGRTVYFKFTATDNAGNVAESTVSQIDFPKKVALTTALDSNATNSTQMSVDLSFGLTPFEFKKYTKFTISRTRTGGSLPNLNLMSSSLNFDSGGAFVPSGNWTVDSGGILHYADNIPVNSGAGHKRWTYEVSTTPVITPQSPSDGVTLPNNPGSLSFEFVDMNGVPASDTANFVSGENGEIQVRLTASDPDREDWLLDVNQVTVTTTTSNGKKYTLESRQSLSGNSPIHYIYSASNGYQVLTVPIQPSFVLSGVNNIQIAWMEAGDADASYRSDLKEISFHKKVGGGYFINISDVDENNVVSDSQGLWTRPGQQLVFDVSSIDGGDISALQWDFGDGSDQPLPGPKQQHAYHQVENQTADSVERTLLLTIPTGTSSYAVVPLKVTVRDTQEGVLYENEIWRGPHTVTGVVRVPEGLSLSIENNTTVSFRGGVGAGHNQGLQISGSLIIHDTAILKKSDDQTESWGTVRVDGIATIGAATIRDADRGVAVGPVGRLDATGTVFTNNLTGVHVVGSTQVHLSSCFITTNSVYGVKEDAGGRPTLVGCTIGKTVSNPAGANFRNYYSQTLGLLNISQINALAGNSGNTGGQ